MATARVLVVDDEPTVLGLVSKALSVLGYEVQAVSCPLEALKLAHDSPCFDLVLSDVIMPLMCGPEFVKRVAELCPNAALVLMSAHVVVEKLPKGAAFINKPFRVKDLCSVVEKALARSAALE